MDITIIHAGLNGIGKSRVIECGHTNETAFRRYEKIISEMYDKTFYSVNEIAERVEVEFDQEGNNITEIIIKPKV